MIQRLNQDCAGGTINPNSLLGNSSHGLNGLFLKLRAGNVNVVLINVIGNSFLYKEWVHLMRFLPNP